MNIKRFPARFVLKGDTEVNWAQVPDFVPLDRELIEYKPDSVNTLPRFKVGDGKTKLIDLPFIMDTSIFADKEWVNQLGAEVVEYINSGLTALTSKIDNNTSQIGSLNTAVTDSYKALEEISAQVSDIESQVSEALQNGADLIDANTKAISDNAKNIKDIADDYMTQTTTQKVSGEKCFTSDITLNVYTEGQNPEQDSYGAGINILGAASNELRLHLKDNVQPAVTISFVGGDMGYDSINYLFNKEQGDTDYYGENQTIATREWVTHNFSAENDIEYATSAEVLKEIFNKE